MEPVQFDAKIEDCVLKCQFLPSTWDGLSKFLWKTQGSDERLLNGTPENWAFLWFLLKEAPDKEEWFPNGKWATVQRIEGLVTRIVRGMIA